MKMSIVTAMAHRPKLLILDEPTSGLDPIVRNEVLDVFRDFIQDEEHSILISSHITGDLEKIADYITFIHKGEVLLSQSKDELICNYGVIKCSEVDFKKLNSKDFVGYRKNNFGYEVLIQDKLQPKYRDYTIDNVTLEDIMLFCVKGE